MAIVKIHYKWQIIEYLESNGLANMLVQIDQQLKLNTATNVPLHVAKRNALGLHEQIGMSLFAEGIHLMPYQALRREV